MFPHLTMCLYLHFQLEGMVNAATIPIIAKVIKTSANVKTRGGGWLNHFCSSSIKILLGFGGGFLCNYYTVLNS